VYDEYCTITVELRDRVESVSKEHERRPSAYSRAVNYCKRPQWRGFSVLLHADCSLPAGHIGNVLADVGGVELLRSRMNGTLVGSN
jgi:hypothetical protein